ncbi:MAG: hypothetical protein WD844_07145 [Thermoleophilaceae bacterium]
MTSERAQAYGRVTRTLDGLSLTPEQQAVIREAADGLLFSEDLAADAPAREALAELRALAGKLVDDDVLEPGTVERLVGEVEDCGPVASVAPVA